jgi:hypothetical protein
MKIANIKATLHRTEIQLPGINESVESRMFVFVEVETDSGMTGFGVTGQFLPWATIAAIENHFLPICIIVCRFFLIDVPYILVLFFLDLDLRNIKGKCKIFYYSFLDLCLQA